MKRVKLTTTANVDDRVSDTSLLSLDVNSLRNVMLNLSAVDVFNLRILSKKFKQHVDECPTPFWLSLIQSQYDLGCVERHISGSMACTLRNDWYCYWSGDYGLPSDSEKDYVFSPALYENNSEFILPGRTPNSSSSLTELLGLEDEPEEIRSVFPALNFLCKLGADMRKYGLSMQAGCWGSEGGCNVSCMILPHNFGDAYGADWLLDVLGCHGEIEGPSEWKGMHRDEYEEGTPFAVRPRDANLRKEADEWLTKFESEWFTDSTTTTIMVGVEKMNPVLVISHKIINTWTVAIIAGVIYT